MKLEVLIATMNRKNNDFLKNMSIASNCVVINQTSETDVRECCFNSDSVKWINVNERGLSRSRNMALENATADICILADDDVHFKFDYEKIISSAHEKYKDADIIAFIVNRTGDTRIKRFRRKKTWNSYIGVMKISSVEITFKRKRIERANIKFNPHLGAGEIFYCGEESTFLYDALRHHLRVLYLPIEIADTDCDDSCWFNGYDEKHLYSLGAAYYNMSPFFYWILSFQFVVRHKKLLDKKYNTFSAYLTLMKGASLYKKLYKK